MIYKAFAKVNLYLSVINKRDDGYHDLQMLNCKIDLADKLSIEIADENKVRYSDARLNTDKNNIVFNILNYMEEKFSLKDKYNIYVEKNIPIGAGLGGGSSDGACLINALDELNKLNLTLNQKIDIAKKFGADIPYCLINCPAIVSGIGEIVEPINKVIDKEIILVYPNIFISTKEVFKKVDLCSAAIKKENLIDYIKKEQYNKILQNDLERPALELSMPLNKIKEDLNKYGDNVMSGSGSAFIVWNTDYYDEIKKTLQNCDVKKVRIIN